MSLQKRKPKSNSNIMGRFVPVQAATQSHPVSAKFLARHERRYPDVREVGRLRSEQSKAQDRQRTVMRQLYPAAPYRHSQVVRRRMSVYQTPLRSSKEDRRPERSSHRTRV